MKISKVKISSQFLDMLKRNRTQDALAGRTCKRRTYSEIGNMEKETKTSRTFT